MGDSYNDGRYGQYSNRSDWNEYQRGLGDAERWNAASTEINDKYNKSYSKGYVPEGAGGGNMIGLIVLAVLIIPVAVSSAICSLVIVLVLQRYIVALEPKYYAPPYGTAYKWMLQATIGFQLLCAATFIVLYLLLTNGVNLPFLNPETINVHNISSSVISPLLIYQLPSILLTARGLARALSGYEKFQGFSGYLRALVFVTLIIVPVLLLANYLMSTAINLFILKQSNLLF